MIMEDNLTKVMWLEEDLFIIDRFKNKAREYELDLQTFNCWEDAKSALLSNIKGWGAIILDPKCKLGKGDSPNPYKFLPQVFCDITSISAKYGSIIPWYVFTEIDPSRFEDLIVNDRNDFDSEWERPYYSTKEDADNLFNRIKMQVSSKDRYNIRNGVHKELFDKMSALTVCGLTQDDISTMEDILISLYENKESKRCNFVNIRKIIENLCKSMMHYNILPNVLINHMGEINLTSCVRLLSGRQTTEGGIQYSLIDKHRVIDKVAGGNLYDILNICNGYVHSTSINTGSRRNDTNNYLEITKTNNLLHACALMMADILIMYYSSLKESNTNTTELFYWTLTQV